MAKWNFRIVKLEYDTGTGYGVETDKGLGGEWYSIYKNESLDKVREVKAEREAKNGNIPKTVTVIE